MFAKQSFVEGGGLSTSDYNRATKAAGIALALMLCLSGCSAYASPTSMATPSAAAPEATHGSATFGPSLQQKAIDALPSFFEDSYAMWFRTHSQARVIPVSITPRDPVSFGPWYARQEFGTAEANDDGSLTEWEHDYFITHDWSEIGQQILCMSPDDHVVVNDRHFVVEDVFNYPKDSFLEEVREVVGPQKVVFQTCYPDSDVNRIVCVHEIVV